MYIWYFQSYVAASERMQSVEFGRFCLFVRIVQETVLIWGAVKHRHTVNHKAMLHLSWPPQYIQLHAFLIS